MGRGREARPIEERGTLWGTRQSQWCDRLPTRTTDAWWPVSRFRANVLVTARSGKGAQGGGAATMKRMVAAAVDDVDELIERYYRAQREFLRGNPEPVKNLFSHTEDVSLANPYGPPVRGFDEVAKTIEHAASLR